jgi:hypothetical protein
MRTAKEIITDLISLLKHQGYSETNTHISIVHAQEYLNSAYGKVTDNWNIEEMRKTHSVGGFVEAVIHLCTNDKITPGKAREIFEEYGLITDASKQGKTDYLAKVVTWLKDGPNLALINKKLECQYQTNITDFDIDGYRIRIAKSDTPKIIVFSSIAKGGDPVTTRELTEEEFTSFLKAMPLSTSHIWPDIYKAYYIDTAPMPYRVLVIKCFPDNKGNADVYDKSHPDLASAETDFNNRKQWPADSHNSFVVVILKDGEGSIKRHVIETKTIL